MAGLAGACSEYYLPPSSPVWVGTGCGWQYGVTGNAVSVDSSVAILLIDRLRIWRWESRRLVVTG